jgi:hypothetical protein
MPENTYLHSNFQELKWRGIMHNYKIADTWWSIPKTIDAKEMLIQYACNDHYTAAADTILQEMYRATRLVINANGPSVNYNVDKLNAWKQLYTCLHDPGEGEADKELLRRFRALLDNKQYMEAGALLYNMAGSGLSKSVYHQAQKEMFALMQSASEEVARTTDLYTLSCMFPENAIGKQLQKDASVRTISELLDKKNFSQAGIKLRAQMQLDPNDANIRALYKKWIAGDFLTHYMGSATYADLNQWTGSSVYCRPGTLPDSVHDKVLERLNYVRRLAGLPDNCEFRDEWNAQCMAAAMMMTANGNLSHNPTRNWTCYSEEGARAAGMSNLGLGHGGSEALMGQVYDDGWNNSAVGHRRWILNPYRKVFGHGSNANSMALWALGGNDADQPANSLYNKLYVAWPAAHFFPANLVPARWSLSRSNADFTDAKVEMYIGNRRLDLKILPLDDRYGLPTIVWEPVIPSAKAGQEVTLRIVVKNIRLTGEGDERTGKSMQVSQDYTYTTTLIPLF